MKNRDRFKDVEKECDDRIRQLNELAGKDEEARLILAQGVAQSCSNLIEKVAAGDNAMKWEMAVRIYTRVMEDLFGLHGRYARVKIGLGLFAVFGKALYEVAEIKEECQDLADCTLDDDMPEWFSVYEDEKHEYEALRKQAQEEPEEASDQDEDEDKDKIEELLAKFAKAMDKDTKVKVVEINLSDLGGKNDDKCKGKCKHKKSHKDEDD